MRDTLSPKERSLRMSLVRGKDTQPELVLRKALHCKGYRYRLHVRALPGTPDLVFSSRGRVLFVHGCFWHRHAGCKLARLPKSRISFWKRKLEGNRARDKQNQKRLNRIGWRYMTVWECQLSDLSRVLDRVTQFLGKPREKRRKEKQ